MRATVAAVSTVSVAAPSSVLFPASAACAPTHWRKVVAVERFRRRQRKERMRQQPCDRRRHRRGRRGGAAPSSRDAPVRSRMKSSISALRRAGVAGDRIVRAIDEGDVGDAAEIEHRDRARPMTAGKRPVIDRHQRRALPARRHVRGAEVINHRNVDLARQRRAVADLDGQPLPRSVQDGLAVKADDVDGAAVDPVGVEERVDGGRVQRGDHGSASSDHGRPLPARAQRRRLHGAPQHATSASDRNAARSARTAAPLAVGLDQGDIDAVHRGAAHQPDRRIPAVPEALHWY